ncbi:MAG: nucleotidyltransferase domain-containing protein [Oscillospiraceae bacterium]|nr:nucleotidyltransferase domain-containing protein [Oscillospiraceae bacterium]
MILFDDAIQIATAFSKEIDSKFPNKIKAVFAIGSLGSDYYRPGQSDIDTAVIVDAARDGLVDIAIEIGKIAQEYQDKYDVPKGFGAIVFAEEQLYPPYIKEEELIQEILRLKTQARQIYGEYDLEKIPMPDWNAVKADILNFQEWVDSEPAFEHSSTSFVNSTLIALKRYLLLKHHIIEFNKFKVVDLYEKNEPILVNKEIFEFIDNYLHDKNYEWNEDIRDKYVMWHDELYRVINDAVLYNEEYCFPNDNHS